MKKTSKIIIGSSLAAAVLVGGGAYAATNILGDKEINMATAAPASSAFYVEVDLNPSMQQKASALALNQKLAALDEDDEIEEDDTLGESLYKQDFEGLNYETDIQPWMGTQFIATGVDGDAEKVIRVYEITDQKLAEEAVAKIDSSLHHAVTEKFVVVAESEEDYNAYNTALAAGALSDNEIFNGDRKKFTDDIAYMWTDLAKIDTSEQLSEEVGESGLPEVPEISGRIAASLSLSGNSVNLDAKTLDLSVEGVESWNTDVTGGESLGNLSSDTIGGIGIADPANTIKKNWEVLSKDVEADQMQEMENAIGSLFGVEVPEELDKVLGSNLAFGYESDEEMLLVTKDSDVSAWETFAETLPMLMGSGSSESVDVNEEDGYVHFKFAEGKPSSSEGKLSDHKLYATALPDLSNSQSSVWLDINKLVDMEGDAKEGVDEGVLGATVAYSEADKGHDIKLRWVFE